MLFFLRVITILPLCILICIFGSIYCLCSPRNPRHSYFFGRLFAKLTPLFGLKVETRLPANAGKIGNCVYIANHQSNYDLITAAGAVQMGTVTVGKRSLVWIPFFGQLYWLTGNILIDRNNRAKSHGTIAQIVEQMKKRDLSIWMFPEGTRSRGRGLMPFKTGAFHTAVATGFPIVPICVSTTTNKIKLNRWHNGLVIVEMLPPIDTTGYHKDNIRELAEYCRNIMIDKIAELDKEVAEREKAMKKTS